MQSAVCWYPAPAISQRPPTCIHMCGMPGYGTRFLLYCGGLHLEAHFFQTVLVVQGMPRTKHLFLLLCRLKPHHYRGRPPEGHGRTAGAEAAAEAAWDPGTSRRPCIRRRFGCGLTASPLQGLAQLAIRVAAVLWHSALCMYNTYWCTLARTWPVLIVVMEC